MQMAPIRSVREQSYAVPGKRLSARQDATLRATGDHSPCACASMVADVGVRAAGLPGASRKAGGGARARDAAGPAARVRPPPAHLSRALRGRGGGPGAACTAAVVSSAASSAPGPHHAGKEPAAGRHLPAALRMAPGAPTRGSGRLLGPYKRLTQPERALQRGGPGQIPRERGRRVDLQY